jgi:hypothetical protein
MAIFEAPIAHEAVQYSTPESPYSNPELTGEFEDEASPYSTPEYEYEGLLGNIISGIGGLLGGGEGEVGELGHEWEGEFEDEASPYSTPEYEYEGLLGNIISGIGGLLGGGEGEVGELGHEWEGEYEDEASPYSTPEYEYEGLLGNIISGIGGLLGGGEVGQWEYEANPYSNPELEYEADLFFKRFKRAIGKVARSVAPIARRLAPGAARGLVSMIPGVGMIAGPLAGKLVGSLVSEAEMEVAEMEHHFLNTLAETGELEHPEVHEAVLSEVLAGQAIGAESEAEASALTGSIVPLTIRVMRAQRTVRPVAPALVQANVRLVRTLRRQGPVGRELLAVLPEINRLAVAILHRAARLRRLTSPLAVRAMAVATRRVMSNPRRVQRAIKRNMVVRVRANASRPRGRLPLRAVPRRQRMRVGA